MKKDGRWPLYIEVIASKHQGFRGYAYAEKKDNYKVVIFIKDGAMFKTEIQKSFVRPIKSWKGNKNEKNTNSDRSAANSFSNSTSGKTGGASKRAKGTRNGKSRINSETGYLKSNY